MPKISIGNKELKIPLIQGGMGVGISLSNLAGTVASYGAMGTISGVNPSFKSPNFLRNPLEENSKALIHEIQGAKKIARGEGLIAVNIMYAIENYKEMVEAAVAGGADAIVSGAGLPLNLPQYVDKNILLAPIVSSLRALKIVHKAWMKRYNRILDFVIVEGPLAGGHLGFKETEMENASLDNILWEIVPWIKAQEDQWGKKVPIFAAGGIRDSHRVKELMKLGVDGIQLGTPFILTHECDADIAFKNAIKEAKNSDLEIIKSPVGMPARAIRNSFVKRIETNKEEIKRCLRCLKTCDPQKSPYCIAKALGKSAKGQEGLIFSGAEIDSLDEILWVKEVLDRFLEGI